MAGRTSRFAAQPAGAPRRRCIRVPTCSRLITPITSSTSHTTFSSASDCACDRIAALERQCQPSLAQHPHAGRRQSGRLLNGSFTRGMISASLVVGVGRSDNAPRSGSCRLVGAHAPAAHFGLGVQRPFGNGGIRDGLGHLNEGVVEGVGARCPKGPGQRPTLKPMAIRRARQKRTDTTDTSAMDESWLRVWAAAPPSYGRGVMP